MSIKNILGMALAGVMLIACNNEQKGANEDLTRLEGGLTSGGVLRVNEIENFRTLFPPGILDLYSHHISNQVYQGLVKLNTRTLDVEPCLAESYESNEDATVWTFRIRQGVKFHDDQCFPDGKGREFTANDAKYCLDNICSQMKANKQFELLSSRVLGAKEHYNATGGSNPAPAGGVEGIEVVDDHTLRITLVKSVANFDKILTHVGLAMYPREAFEKYGDDMRVHAVGTGPFMLKKVKENDMVFLDRNPNYWEKDEHGNQLPYLQGVKFTFIKDKKQEILDFKNGNLDMVHKVPSEEVKSLMPNLEAIQRGDEKSDFQDQSDNALNVVYFGFLHTHPIFKDVRVRKAFNLAVNRHDLIDNVLDGEGVAADYGFVPPMEGYSADSVRGNTWDVEEARRLMAEAGFASGENFPEITLNYNSGGRVRDLVATAIQAQLRNNLGVSIKLNALPFDQHQNIYESGDAAMWMIGWIADYPDPENFLDLFHSRHLPEDLSQKVSRNASRYINPQFDELLAEAQGTTDAQERNRLLVQADQMLVDDAVVMPLYYEHVTQLVKRYVKNLHLNSMEYRDFTRVYKDLDEVAEIEGK